MTFQLIIRASSSLPPGARCFSRDVGANKHVKRRFSKVPRQLLPSLDRVPLLPHEGQAESLPAPAISCLWWNCGAGEGSRPPGCYPSSLSGSVSLARAPVCLPQSSRPMLFSVLAGPPSPTRTWEGCGYLIQFAFGRREASGKVQFFQQRFIRCDLYWPTSEAALSPFLQSSVRNTAGERILECGRGVAGPHWSSCGKGKRTSTSMPKRSRS